MNKWIKKWMRKRRANKKRIKTRKLRESKRAEKAFEKQVKIIKGERLTPVKSTKPKTTKTPKKPPKTQQEKNLTTIANIFSGKGKVSLSSRVDQLTKMLYDQKQAQTKTMESLVKKMNEQTVKLDRLTKGKAKYVKRYQREKSKVLFYKAASTPKVDELLDKIDNIKTKNTRQRGIEERKIIKHLRTHYEHFLTDAKLFDESPTLKGKQAAFLGFNELPRELLEKAKTMTYEQFLKIMYKNKPKPK